MRFTRFPEGNQMARYGKAAIARPLRAPCTGGSAEDFAPAQVEREDASRAVSKQLPSASQKPERRAQRSLARDPSDRFVTPTLKANDGAKFRTRYSRALRFELRK